MQLRSITGLALATVSLAATAVLVSTVPAGAQVGYVCSSPPKPTITISDDAELEGGIAQVNVQLSNAFCTNVTVNYTTANGTATAFDYVPTAGVLVFTPGQTVKAISVPVRCDSVYEPVEFFRVVLGAPVNATIVDGLGIVRIYNATFCQPTHG